MPRKKITMDGNHAAAHASYAFTEVAAIYPITPSTPMAEATDEWAAAGQKNLFGQSVSVMEMQSEAGAAGAVHGALTAGALTSTYTASQGLLLMIPNLYKIAGEQLPGVFHVAARTVATHALSIFGDHSDIYACRQTGCAMLCESSVQEVMDLTPAAHLAALEGSVPFINFFDGFRTSHEIQKIEAWDYEELRELLPEKAVENFRKRALSPEHPHLMGSAQNPDVYFQVREASNKHYEEIPRLVQNVFDRINDKIGTDYRLFNYYGAPDAEHVIIAMGSVNETIAETVDYLNGAADSTVGSHSMEAAPSIHSSHPVENTLSAADNHHGATAPSAPVPHEKVGLIKVRLYRPFCAEALLAEIPDTVRRITVLDRTKEPGAMGEPLYLDVLAALKGSRFENVPIFSGRYGLSSRDTTPAQILAVYRNREKSRFTIGITDDVTHLSLDTAEEPDTSPKGTVRAKFWGLGSDGTVGANKNSIKIIGDHTDLYVQAYFDYDSRKSGGVTMSHLRFGKEKIRSTYLIRQADFVACHNPSYINKYKIVQELRDGGTFLLNCPWKKEELEEKLPDSVKRFLAEHFIRFFIIDATGIGIATGMGATRINTILQSAFFKLTQIVPYEDANRWMKEAVQATYGHKGEDVVEKNLAAIDAGAEGIEEVKVPERWKKCSCGEDALEQRKKCSCGEGALEQRKDCGCGEGALEQRKDCGCRDEFFEPQKDCTRMEDFRLQQNAYTHRKPPASDPAAQFQPSTLPALPQQRAAETFVTNIQQKVNAQEGHLLPVSAFLDYADGATPSGTSAYEKRGIAVNVPKWLPENCIQCNFCSYVCPHAVIRPAVMTEEEAQRAPVSSAPEPTAPAQRAPISSAPEPTAHAQRAPISSVPEPTAHAQHAPASPAHSIPMNGLPDLRFAVTVSVLDCTGCGSCAHVCPGRQGQKALVMQPLDSQREQQKMADYARHQVAPKPEVLQKFRENTVKGSQFRQPLLEFHGACAGCGETPYAKLVTQLFGDRMYIANATGCSSIWGNSSPSAPYTFNREGRGPAWGNSLFEDNAEYGLGMLLAQKTLRNGLRQQVEQLEEETADETLRAACRRYLDTFEIGTENQEATDQLVAKMHTTACLPTPLVTSILQNRAFLSKKSHWLFGGDGWAYDIGFGGLDHVLASGEDINILVFNTEVYSNTGGQASKATPAGAVAQLAAGGKKTGKKDLAAIAMSYGNVYVAQIAMGADYNQCIRAITEAESYPGPSLIIAYAPCISHGIKKGMSSVQSEEKLAVESGYWQLFRFQPAGPTFHLDSKPPTRDFHEFLHGEIRYTALAMRDADAAEQLQSSAKQQAEDKFLYLQNLQSIYNKE